MNFKQVASYIFALWGIILLSYMPFADYQEIYEELATFLFLILFGFPALLAVAYFFVYWIVIRPFFMFPDGKTFKIKPGKHRSVRRFALFFNKAEHIFKIYMHKGWIYSKPHDQHNKIVGVNWGLPKIVKENGKWRVIHANSLRITQTTDPHYDSMVVSFYGYYQGKKLENKRIAFVKREKPFYFIASQKRLRKLVRMTYGEDSQEYKDFYKNISRWGYFLHPYHGGKKPAEKEGRVTIYKKKTLDTVNSWTKVFS